MNNRANLPIHFQQYSAGKWKRIESEVIVERSVSLTVNGDVWLSFRCTPVDLEAMALGFLYNEGLIDRLDEVAVVRPCESGDNIDVWLHKAIEKPERWQRTSGCTGGVTRLEGEEWPEQAPGSVRDGLLLSPAAVCQQFSLLIEHQQLYRRSGGVHTSALSDGRRIHLVAEDIGRHNTLDKLAGHLLMDELQLPQRMILTTGRISSEMLQKSARLGASVVISRTAPSSLSIRLAERWGVTLIGYARRNRFNLYTHPERITENTHPAHQPGDLGTARDNARSMNTEPNP